MLEPFDYVSGSLSLIILIISIFIVCVVLYKYNKLREKNFIYFAISITILVEPWWPGAISFIMVFFNNGSGLPDQAYRFLGNVFIPIGLLAWTILCTDLIFTQKRKILIYSIIITGIVFEVLFFIVFFTEPSYIGILKGEVDIEYKWFTLGYLIGVVGYIFFTGFAFSIETIKTGEPEYKLKGSFMIVGFILFVVSAAIDAMISVNSEMLLITRSVLITGIIFLYLGFFIPKRLLNWLLSLK